MLNEVTRSEHELIANNTSNTGISLVDVTGA